MCSLIELFGVYMSAFHLTVEAWGCSACVLSSVGSAVTNGSGPGAHAYLTNKGKCSYFFFQRNIAR